jgi:hypothetical protein
MLSESQKQWDELLREALVLTRVSRAGFMEEED